MDNMKHDEEGWNRLQQDDARINEQLAKQVETADGNRPRNDKGDNNVKVEKTRQREGDELDHELDPQKRRRTIEQALVDEPRSKRVGGDKEDARRTRRRLHEERENAPEVNVDNEDNSVLLAESFSRSKNKSQGAR